VHTPEGVELQLFPAGPGVRTKAWMLDFLIKSCIAAITAAFFFGIFGSAAAGPYLIMQFILQWFYPVFFDVFYKGVSPGKKIMRLQVLCENGTPIDFRASMLRNLLRPADFLPVFNLAGFISMLLTTGFRRLGDLAAGTIVIFSERSDISPEHQNNLIGITPPATGYLMEDERRALIRFFCTASGGLSERHIEIAEILSPITGLRGKKNAEYIFSWGAGLIGTQISPQKKSDMNKNR